MNVKTLRNDLRRSQKSTISESQRALPDIDEDQEMDDLSNENQVLDISQSQPEKQSEIANDSKSK